MNKLRRLWVAPSKAILRRAGSFRPIGRIAGKIVDYQLGENDTNFLDNGELHLLREIAPRLNVVFDVGANIGEWTDHVLAVRPDAEIHCFEPVTATFKMLDQKEYPPRIHRHHLGLSNENAALEMNVFSDGSPLNSLYKRDGRDLARGETENAEFVTLDAFMASNRIARIDLLKIDTEGHEIPVMEGAKNALEGKTIGAVQFEYSSAWIDGRHFLKDIFDLAFLKSYRLYKIMPNGLAPIDRYRYELDNFHYANYVLINKELNDKL